jgi:hypothetical protein
LLAGNDATADDAEPKVSGKIVVIGPDGVKKEFDFGKADKDCDANGCSIQVGVDDGKVTVVGPKGNKQEFNIDEKAAKRGHIMGKVVIIGPDGKPKEIDLGTKLDLDQLLPKEVRKQFEKALEGQPEHIRKILEGYQAFGRLMTQPMNRTMLGVALDGSRDEARVAGVLDDSPAKKAGFRKDDVVIAVDDKEIESPAELMSAIGKHKPGDRVVIKIRRGKEEITKKVTLEERTKVVPEHPAPNPVRNLQRQIRRLQEQNKRLVERIEKLEKAIEKKSE